MISQSMKQAKATDKKAGRRQPRVLITEDDPWFADSLAATLHQNFSVRIVANPEKVFDAIETWRPDALLADIMLGPKNVFTLLNELASYYDTRTLNVVILSSIGHSIDQHDMTRFNVKAVFDKSDIEPEMLRNELLKITEKMSRRAQNGTGGKGKK